jgi:acid stress chaperone HdeB
MSERRNASAAQVAAIGRARHTMTGTTGTPGQNSFATCSIAIHAEVLVDKLGVLSVVIREALPGLYCRSRRPSASCARWPTDVIWVSVSQEMSPPPSGEPLMACDVVTHQDDDVSKLRSRIMKMMKMMMRAISLGIASMVLTLSTAQAQTTIDAAKITCDQFIGLKVASPENIAIWLSGYYHGKRGSTIIDVQQLKEQPQKMTSYCLYEDRTGSVMEAAEKMLSQGK